VRILSVALLPHASEEVPALVAARFSDRLRQRVAVSFAFESGGMAFCELEDGVGCISSSGRDRTLVSSARTRWVS
jgi:hypothetical protein